MIRGCLRLAFIIFSLYFSLCQAEADAVDYNGLSRIGGFSVSLTESFDSTSNARAIGLDIDAAILYVNVGFSGRAWDNEIVGWNNKRLQTEIAEYIGIGYMKIIELQFGYSTAGTSLRLRSDIVLGDKSDEIALNILPFVEYSPWASNKRTVYGIGIGIAY